MVMRLEAENLATGYGHLRIGSEISLGVGQGEILCLLGPNGCGKTTLFRTLLGLLPPLAGSIMLDGDDLASLPRSTIARRIAYVPQAHMTAFPFMVADIVLMGRTAATGLFSRPGGKDRGIAMAALERLGIADLAERDYTTLSGGQRQLVLIARALAQQAGIIVMDEPTASLDFANQSLVLAEIAKLARAEEEEACGILLSTHDPDQAFLLDAGVALMAGGGIAARGRAAVILTGEALSRVYGISITVEKTPSGRSVCSTRLVE